MKGYFSYGRLMSVDNSIVRNDEELWPGSQAHSYPSARQSAALVGFSF